MSERNGIGLQEHIGEDMLAFAIGDVNMNTCISHDTGGVVFTLHASAASRRMFGLKVLAEVVTVWHFADDG